MRHCERCEREPAVFAPCPWEWGSRAARAGWNWVQESVGRVGWVHRRLEAELPQGCGGSALTPLTSSAFSRYEAHWAVTIAQRAPDTTRQARPPCVLGCFRFLRLVGGFRLFRSFPPSQVILRKPLKKKVFFFRDISRLSRENQENGWCKTKADNIWCSFTRDFLASTIYISHLYITKLK